MLHSREIGEFRVSSLVEYYGPTHFPKSLLPDLDPGLLENNRDWLVPNHWYPNLGRFVTSIQIWIINAGADVIVVDPGVGNHKPRTNSRHHMMNTIMPQWLEAAGALRDRVTHVVMTHLHPDHVGWNTVLEGGRWVPMFPNARYYIPKENYDCWKDAIQRGISVPEGGGFADSIQPILEAGLAEFIDTQKEIAGCLSVEPLPGHTPGHLNFRIRSRGEEGVFGGDVMHHPIQIVCPTLNTCFDLIPDLACRNRASFVADAARTGALIMPAHFGPPHCGYVRQQAGSYRFEPATW